MTDADRVFLVSLHQQGLTQIALLTEIRDLLSMSVAAQMDIEDTDECQHPEEHRVNLSTPGDMNHWICNLCRFDNKAAAAPMN